MKPEKLAKLNNDFTDGEKLNVKELEALVNFWRKEHDKLLNAYQNKMAEIAGLAVPCIAHPNSWKT